MCEAHVLFFLIALSLISVDGRWQPIHVPWTHLREQNKLTELEQDPISRYEQFVQHKHYVVQERGSLRRQEAEPASATMTTLRPQNNVQNVPPTPTIIHTGNHTSVNHTIIFAPVETDPASALPPLFAITSLNWDRLDELGGLTKSEVAKLLITLYPFLITVIFFPLYVITVGVLTLPVIRIETVLSDENS